MSPEERAAIERMADARAAEAPPVSDEVKARLRVLLRGDRRRTSGRPDRRAS